MGPTLIAYLCRAEAGAAGTIEATATSVVVSMTGALWLAATEVMGAAATAGAVAAAVAAAAVGAAATATVGRGATTTTVGSEPGLDPPIGGGEERRTQGLKLCPPRVLTMPGPNKGRRWREWEEEDFFGKEEKGFEMKMK